MFIKARLTSFFGSKTRRNQSLAILCATLITGTLLTGVASAQGMMPTPPVSSMVNPTVITNISSAVAREMTAGINEVISSTTRSALHANDDAADATGADADDDAVHAGAVADAKGAADVCAGTAVSEDGECAAK